MTTHVKIVLFVLAVFAVVGIIIYSTQQKTPAQESEIVSRTGLHWHPALAISVQGVHQEIPAGIGLGVVHKPMHTHDADGIIHLEFPGLVKKSDLQLGQFFKNWGKDMRSFGASLKMIVNGKENTEYEQYVLQDNDRIELRYDE